MRIREFLIALVAVVTGIAAAGVITKAVAAPQVGASNQTGLKALIDELVIANHILANERVVDAYGHVSVRSPTDPNRFLLARQGPPGLVTADAIVEYDLDSKPVQSAAGSAGYSERFIHGEIYRARPDVMATATRRMSSRSASARFVCCRLCTSPVSWAMGFRRSRFATRWV